MGSPSRLGSSKWVGSLTVMKGTPPEMEANAVEAPDFKEAEAEAFWMREEAKPEANALPPMRLLASLIFC